MNDHSDRLRALRGELDRAESERLSPLACPSTQALRRREDPHTESGHRQNFQVDADRILHSLAYTRYIDKTQVFYLVKNDHITHRVLHVQLVAKISRTIGRMLNLNEDLIEAIALGHDLGHVPFGHDGEQYLSDLSKEYGLPPFLHSVQSVRALDVLENRGRGLNLSLQVLDGILGHDGESDRMDLTPDRDKDFDRLDRELEAKQARPKDPLSPMTLEGCVVRMADTIAYIGRDFEDAIRLGLLDREELPEEIGQVLGRTNGTIVFRLVEDLISTSLDRDRVGFSPRFGVALKSLKDFNRAKIYLNPKIKFDAGKIENLFQILFAEYLRQVRAEDRTGPIVSEFLSKMDKSYHQNTAPEMIVRDFMAGMTDAYFLSQAKSMLIPEAVD